MASSSKPRSASRLTGKMTKRLSRLATETNTVPRLGSGPKAATWLLAKAVPKPMSMPITSPVDFISGPRMVSTEVPSTVRKRLNGITASLTAIGPVCDSVGAVTDRAQQTLAPQSVAMLRARA